MKPHIGMTLPTFAARLEPAVEAARVAEDGGLDGVFSFDHLWPMSNPGRPALWSFAVLAAIAARTSRVRFGTLVARVDLFSEDDHVARFESLAAIGGAGRVIAAIGTGDHLSRPENEAYGLRVEPAADRLADAGRLAARLRSCGIETWIGGMSAATADVATRCSDAINLWGAPRELLIRRAAGGGHVPRVTWGGQVLVGRDRAELEHLRQRFGDRPGLVSGTVEEVAAHFTDLAGAGATWCVGAPLDYLAQPARAAETMCLVAKAVH